MTIPRLLILQAAEWVLRSVGAAPLGKMVVFSLLFVSPQCVVLANDPGEDNPITPERRMLFPDQHALIAVPKDPSTSQADTTYTDWARNEDATTLILQESFGATLSGAAQARAAAGHILSQSNEQVTVGRFVGSGGTNTLQVDVLSPDGTLGAASAQFPGWSVNGYTGRYDLVDSFDLASGELSLLTDAEGAGHDEVVVCYPVRESGQGTAAVYRMWVRVLDYTDASASAPAQTAAKSAQTMRASSQYDYERISQENGSGSFVSCDVADLDGDGVEEVVLAYLTGAYDLLRVEVFSYTNDGDGVRTLEAVGSPLALEPLPHPDVDSEGSGLQFVGSVDVATGDFDSDGREEIGIASVSMAFTVQGLAYYPAVFIADSNSALELALQSTFVTDEVAYLSTDEFYDRTGSFACTQPLSQTQEVRRACEFMRAGMVSGLFDYSPDPLQGLDFNRRQLAVVFNMPYAQGGGLRVVSLSVSDDLQNIAQNGLTQPIHQQSCQSGLCPSSPRFMVGAGGFVGAGDLNDPLWSLVIANWEGTQAGTAKAEAAGQFRLAWLKALADGGGFSSAQDETLLGGDDLSGPISARLPVAAWDREGNSVWLGSPVHLVVHDLIQADYIIQEPPKHTYWWPPSATNAADGQIIDVSRKYGFYVELSDSESLDYSFTHKDQTDWTIGGSVAVTGKASVTGGVDAGIFGAAKATASLSVKGKIGYDYNQNVDEYDSSYRSQTTTFTGTTNADDLLIADLMLIDVWRYPVSGIELEDGLNAFWEIAFPGGTVTAQGGGLNFDWYNPPHENGNILSYPQMTGLNFTPEDCCAEFTFVEDSQEVTEAIPFLDDRLLFWDGTAATIDLKFSEKTGEGSTKKYTHKLKESLDVQVGYKSEAKSPGGTGGVTAETTVDVNINNSNSWADVDTQSASTNNSTGFKLVKQVGNSNRSYAFLPAFYLAESGTTKVSYAVDPLTTGATFWPEIYGQLPDPALNLPRRFSPTTPSKKDEIVWVVNESDDAKRMRGFFVRYNTPDAADGYPLVGGAVTDGEVIRIEASVYNYSTAVGLDGLDITFEAVKYNPATNREVGDPVRLDCGTGSITSLSLLPRARKKAICVWDTSGFGPAVSSAIQYYRVYITLDPNDRITELYEGTEGPGQNNRGFGLVGVAHPEETYRTPTPTDAVPEGADVHLAEDGLAIEVDGELVYDFAQVAREQLAPLRVCAGTDQTQTGYHHVQIWNEHPESGWTLIADKMLPGIDRSGKSCVWLPDFRFADAGVQTLHAEVLETPEDGLLGNNLDTLEVIAEEIPALDPQQASGIAEVAAEDYYPWTELQRRWGPPRWFPRSPAGGRDLTLSARFAYAGNLDLSASRLVIASVLNELQGDGELIPSVFEETDQDLVLQAVHSTQHLASYRTPQGQTPRVGATMRYAKGQLWLSLQILDAQIGQPDLCGAQTNLTTDIVLLDGKNGPVELNITEPWTCERNARGQLRKLRLNLRSVAADADQRIGNPTGYSRAFFRCDPRFKEPLSVVQGNKKRFRDTPGGGKYREAGLWPGETAARGNPGYATPAGLRCTPENTVTHE